MPPETVDHRTLTELVRAEAVQAAHVVGQAGGWSIVVQCGASERAVAATRSREVRVFKRLETLVGYLKDMGLDRFDVDAAGYDVGITTHRRPDASEALKRAHEAAAHAKWFRTQIEEAVRDADDPAAEPSIEHEVVKADMARQRAVLKAQIATSGK